MRMNEKSRDRSKYKPVHTKLHGMDPMDLWQKNDKYTVFYVEN